MNVLILGYGNPGRGDDGLGPALVRELASRAGPGLTLVTDYQLMVEHAAQLAEHDVAVLADAAMTGPEPFDFIEQVGVPDPGASFTTHILSPADLVALARTLYGHCARTFVLGIRGEAFDEYREGLSETGARHLQAAVAFLAGQLDRGFDPAPRPPR